MNRTYRRFRRIESSAVRAFGAFALFAALHGYTIVIIVMPALPKAIRDAIWLHVGASALTIVGSAAFAVWEYRVSLRAWDRQHPEERSDDSAD